MRVFTMTARNGAKTLNVHDATIVPSKDQGVIITAPVGLQVGKRIFTELGTPETTPGAAGATFREKIDGWAAAGGTGHPSSVAGTDCRAPGAPEPARSPFAQDASQCVAVVGKRASAYQADCKIGIRVLTARLRASASEVRGGFLSLFGHRKGPEIVNSFWINVLYGDKKRENSHEEGSSRGA